MTPSGLTERSGIHNLEIEGMRIRCQVDADHLTAVLSRLIALGLRSLVSQPPTLEELFMRHYQTLRAAA